ncbi:MAG: hypothetical protein ACK5N9_08280 [Pirellula sp.]
MFKYACGSTTGAGAAGAAAGAGVGAAAGAVPHELQELPVGIASQAVGQPESQQIFFEKILPSNPPPHRLPSPLSQLGAAHGSQAAISAPQDGPQAAISAPQVGPHGSHDVSQQLFLDASMPRSIAFLQAKSLRIASKIGVRRGVQQLASTPQLGPQPHGSAISAPQVGAAQGSAPSHPPDGPSNPLPRRPQPLPQFANSTPQEGSHEAISAPHDGSQTEVSQQELEAPQPLPPNNRPKRSPPKLWLLRAAPRTIEPTTIFHFI